MGFYLISYSNGTRDTTINEGINDAIKKSDKTKSPVPIFNKPQSIFQWIIESNDGPQAIHDRIIEELPNGDPLEIDIGQPKKIPSHLDIKLLIIPIKKSSINAYPKEYSEKIYRKVNR